MSASPLRRASVSPSSREEDAASAQEARWVESKLIGALIADARHGQLANFIVIPLVFGVLYGRVHVGLLLTWAVLALAMSLYRRYTYGIFQRMAAADPLDGPARFLEHYGFTWPFNAVLLGLPTWAHFGDLPIAEQFVCWLILAATAAVATIGYSAHLKTLRIFLSTLALVGLTGIVVRLSLGLSYGPRWGSFQYWLMGLLVLYWGLMWHAGGRLHVTYRNNFELQYRNRELIDSLRRESRASAEAMEIKNRFLASAAHDIRQPVHALALYAEMLASEPQMVDDLAPKIVRSTAAVNGLFDSLFDLVRLDSGKINVHVESIDIEEFLQDMALQYRPRAEAKGLKFRLHAVQGRLLSDPILLRRILGNLLDNAIKYTVKGGILLAARHARGGVRLEVWDSGIGIPPEHHLDVFQEFYKVMSQPGDEEGFGLGLAIVARLNAVLGHTISMQSRPDRGTRFRLEVQADDTHDSGARAESMLGA